MIRIRNTFIVIADDSGATSGRIPTPKDDKPSLARRHYDLLSEYPYTYDLDSFNFEIFCQKNDIEPDDRETHREAFFSKGHPCMRASPLTKTHGFGAHYDDEGRIAIYPVESEAYGRLANNPGLRVEMAMRSRRPGKI